MATGTIINKDTGWITATLTPSFEAYSASSRIAYRKIDGVVTVIGEVTPASSISAGDTPYTILTLPIGFRSVRQHVAVCQGSVKYIWTLGVDTDGAVTYERYRTGASYATCPAGAQLSFSISFLAD